MPRMTNMESQMSMLGWEAIGIFYVVLVRQIWIDRDIWRCR
jgi:hypothetical protein